MALVLPQFTFAFIASLALQEIFYGNLESAKLFKKLRYAAISCGAVVVLLVAVYFTTSFSNERTKDTKQAITEQLAQSMSQGKQPTQEMLNQASTISSTLIKALVEDRKGLFGSDLIRLIILLLLGGTIIWLGIKNKINSTLAIIFLTFISFIDLITVSSRYLNKSKFTTPDEYLSVFTPTAADNQIKLDTSYYRVFDQAGGDPFQDSRTSYFHNSIGGYSPAKLGLYNDLIEHQLGKGNIEVFNMLNTKYFIVSGPNNQPVAQINQLANGPAWFVKAIKYVNTADEEMLALDSLHSKDTVVIDKREQQKVTISPIFDSSASIKLVKNLNDEIIYQSSATTNQFAVFSEIYYPKGWKAYVDDKETPIVKVDYAFRGVNLPAGNHTIKFEFAPSSYTLGNTLNLAAGIISILSLLICGILLWMQRKKIA
jgi:hypothetical protein